MASLESSFNQKLSLMDKDSDPGGGLGSNSLSPSSFHHCSGSAISPTSPSGDESSSTSSQKRISFGKVFTKNEQPHSIQSPSPVESSSENPVMPGERSKSPSVVGKDYNQNQNPQHSNNVQNHVGKGSGSGSVPGTPTSPGVGKARHPSTSSTGSDKDKSVRVTRKVFNTWRSVCGKKTKDLFKRWKTVPEHQAENGESVEFDRCHVSTSGRNTPSTPGPFEGEGRGTPTSTVGRIKMLVKKHSQVEMPEPEGPERPALAGWSVHVWATYVQRGSLEEEEKEEKPFGRDFLSDFQKTKLIHFFSHVLDMNHDNVISATDFVALNQRIRHYVEWSADCIEFHVLKEVHSGFLECFLNQPLDEGSIMGYCQAEKGTREHVNTDEWLDVWGELLVGKRVMESLPLWLQYFPKILFQVVNRSGSGIISKEELRAFYTMFLGIDFRVVNNTLDSIFNAMTDNGRNRMNYSLYKLCFANFLFGKYPHGPGQYLFGICSQESLDCTFPIDYSALNTPKDDLEPYNPARDKENTNRRSVIV